MRRSRAFEWASSTATAIRTSPRTTSCTQRWLLPCALRSGPDERGEQRLEFQLRFHEFLRWVGSCDDPVARVNPRGWPLHLRTSDPQSPGAVAVGVHPTYGSGIATSV